MTLGFGLCGIFILGFFLGSFLTFFVIQAVKKGSIKFVTFGGGKQETEASNEKEGKKEGQGKVGVEDFVKIHDFGEELGGNDEH